jgi:hypothetical protein
MKASFFEDEDEDENEDESYRDASLAAEFRSGKMVVRNAVESRVRETAPGRRRAAQTSWIFR